MPPADSSSLPSASKFRSHKEDLTRYKTWRRSFHKSNVDDSSAIHPPSQEDQIRQMEIHNFDIYAPERHFAAAFYLATFSESKLEKF